MHLCVWWWRPSTAGPLDPAAEQFLAHRQGSCPGALGSMPLRDAEATTRLVVEAARHAGTRLLIQHEWAGLGRELAPTGDLHVIDEIDHEAQGTAADGSCCHHRVRSRHGSMAS